MRYGLAWCCLALTIWNLRSADIEVLQTADAVVLGWLDFDEWPTPRPQAEIDLIAAEFTDRRHFDYAAAAARSHLLLRKQPGLTYSAIHVRLYTGGRLLLEFDRPLPPITLPGSAVTALGESALIVPGSGAVTTDLPSSLALPDFSTARSATAAPLRTVDLRESVLPVECRENMPQTGANNNSVVSRQSDYPDDPRRQSLYISAKTGLFDPATRAHASTFRFLVEIPLNPDWMLGAGDAEVFVPGDAIRTHMSCETANFYGLGEERLTGNREGGLMQTTQGVAKDAAGNIYVAMSYRAPIRLNLQTGKWESPPVDVYAWLQQFLPAVADLPYPAGTVTDVRLDFTNGVFCHGGRLYLSILRYAVYQKSLTLAALISMPLTDWDDAGKFRAQLRLNAGSWPTAKHPLFDGWVNEDDKLKKLKWVFACDQRLLMLSYHGNFCWVLDLDDSGRTVQLTRLTSLGDAAIERFALPKWAFDATACVGAQMAVTLADAEDEVMAYLPATAHALTSIVPDQISTRPPLFNHPDSIRGEAQLGVTRLGKRDIGQLLGRYGEAGDGTVTIYYDLVTHLQQYAGPCRELLAQRNGPSLGPGYYLSTIPGTRTLLGNAEYISYYHARYELADGIARKTYLRRALADPRLFLGVEALLGPYCHAWLHDAGGDDVLYYAGYTGVCRLPFRDHGVERSQFAAEFLGYQLEPVSLDGAEPGEIKWFRAMAPGLGDKILLTGVGEANRGGTAYSGGLAYFHRRRPHQLFRYSALSAAFRTRSLAWRLQVLGNDELQQEILIPGNYSAEDALTLPADARPDNLQPRIFRYLDAGLDGVHDLYGFTVAANVSSSGIADIAVSRNQLFLLVLFKDGTLATMDLTSDRFIDAVRFDGVLDGFRSGNALLQTPRGRHLVVFSTDSGDSDQDLYLIDTAANGEILVQPLVRCSNRAGDLVIGRQASATFIRGEHGGYDLVVGPPANRHATWLVRIPGLLP